MTMNNMLQIELWRECNNHCKFCYLQEENKKQSEEYKLNAIKNAIEIIRNNQTWTNYDSLGLIGGEFFQGQLNTEALNKEFFSMFVAIEDQFLHSNIKHFWLTMSLTNTQHIYNSFTFEHFIDSLDHLACIRSNKHVSWKNEENQDIWICTSYDTIGRFHTKEAEETWKHYMKIIKDRSEYIHTTTCFIITQDLIDTYNKDKDFFNKFKEEYNTHIYFKCPDIGCNDKTIEDFTKRTKLNNFFPKRADFISFLTDLIKDNDYKDLFNREYRAATLYENIGGDKLRVFKERQNDLISAEDATSPCGHAYWYSRYIDSDKCMMCDRDTVFKEIEDE